MDYFKKLLEQLQCIEDSCEKLRLQIMYEEDVLSAELHDRLVKDLKGDEAIEHFNSYMSLFGLTHLIISEPY